LWKQTVENLIFRLHLPELTYRNRWKFLHGVSFRCRTQVGVVEPRPADNGRRPVLLVDDDEGARELLASLLDRVGLATREASTGVEALAEAEQQEPALVLLDVQLPELSGYEVCRELRDRYGPGLPIIFVSGTRTEPLDRAGGLLIGADDYIVKPFDPDELLARVRRFLPTEDRVRENGDAGDGPGRLTPREREVLGHLANGLSQNEIADMLVISPKTVATHIQRILGKLGVRSRAQAVAFAHRERLTDRL